jgi:hypothetical protein
VVDTLASFVERAALLGAAGGVSAACPLEGRGAIDAPVPELGFDVRSALHPTRRSAHAQPRSNHTRMRAR